MFSRIFHYLAKRVALLLLLSASHSFASITGLYTLNENTGTIAHDQSGKTSNLTLKGGVRWVAGHQASALEFNGINQDVSTPSAKVLQTTSVTISAWIYPEVSQKPWEWIASQADSYGLFISPQDRTTSFYIKGASGDWYAVSSPVNSIKFRQWQHVTGSFDVRTQALKVIVNGQLATSRRVDQNILYDTGNGFSIGSMQHQRHFDGRIDEVRVDNVALSLVKIRQLANLANADIKIASVTPVVPNPKVNNSAPRLVQPTQSANTPIAGLTGRWLLNENTGASANDKTNSHINLTINNGARWTTGHSLSALSFNGANQNASTPSAVLLQNPSVTLSAWVYPRLTQKRWEWIASQSDNFGLFLNPNQKRVVFYIKNKSGHWTSIASSNNSFQFNRWQHVAGSFDSITRTLKVYVNGKVVGVEHSAQGISYDTGNGFSIGSMRHQRFFNGLIDDVQVYGTALSQPEITQLVGASVNIVSPSIPSPTPTPSHNVPNIGQTKFPTSRTVRIMSLGDSITDSLNGRPSFRRPLWFKLKNAGYNVDFVGNASNTEFVRDYDVDHDGYSGIEAGELEQKIGSLLDKINPNIVMLHIGTNDLSDGQSDESTLEEIDGIILGLRERNSSMVILLAKIIPMGHYDTGSFNAKIDNFVASRTSVRSAIVIVDQYSNFNPNDDLYDSFHPNASGEEKMANKWFQALQPFLQGD